MKIAAMKTALLMSLIALSFFSGCAKEQKIVYVKVPCPKLKVLHQNFRSDFPPVKLRIEK